MFVFSKLGTIQSKNKCLLDLLKLTPSFEEKSRLEDLHNPGMMPTAIVKDIALRKDVEIE